MKILKKNRKEINILRSFPGHKSIREFLVAVFPRRWTFSLLRGAPENDGLGNTHDTRVLWVVYPVLDTGSVYRT